MIIFLELIHPNFLLIDVSFDLDSNMLRSVVKLDFELPNKIEREI